MTQRPKRSSRRKNPPRIDPRHALGRAGEAAVSAHYERMGFTVVARNLRTTHGELDLVLHQSTWRTGALLVGVEVKTRRHHGAPERLVQEAELERRAQALAAVARRLLPSVRRLHLRVDIAAVRWMGDMPAEIRLFVGCTRSAP